MNSNEDDSFGECVQAPDNVEQLKRLLYLESNSHFETDQCYITLQREYDQLLQKYAEAENTIDFFRIGHNKIKNCEHCFINAQNNHDPEHGPPKKEPTRTRQIEEKKLNSLSSISEIYNSVINKFTDDNLEEKFLDNNTSERVSQTYLKQSLTHLSEIDIQNGFPGESENHVDPKRNREENAIHHYTAQQCATERDYHVFTNKKEKMASQHVTDMIGSLSSENLDDSSIPPEQYRSTLTFRSTSLKDLQDESLQNRYVSSKVNKRLFEGRSSFTRDRATSCSPDDSGFVETTNQMRIPSYNKNSTPVKCNCTSSKRYRGKLNTLHEFPVWTPSVELLLEKPGSISSQIKRDGNNNNNSDLEKIQLEISQIRDLVGTMRESVNKLTPPSTHADISTGTQNHRSSRVTMLQKFNRQIDMLTESFERNKGCTRRTIKKNNLKLTRDNALIELLWDQMKENERLRTPNNKQMYNYTQKCMLCPPTYTRADNSCKNPSDKCSCVFDNGHL